MQIFCVEMCMKPLYFIFNGLALTDLINRENLLRQKLRKKLLPLIKIT